MAGERAAQSAVAGTGARDRAPPDAGGAPRVPTLFVDATRIALGLWIATAALAAIGLGGQYLRHVAGHPSAYGLIDLFQIGRSHTVPGFFVTLLQLAMGGLLALVAWTRRLRGRGRWHLWALLAASVWTMALSHASGLHRLLGRPTLELIGGDGGDAGMAWVLPAAVLTAALGAACAPLVREMPAWFRRTLLLGALLLVAGSIGVDYVGNAYAKLHGRDNLGFQVLEAVETLLEIAGHILWIRALIELVARDGSRIDLRFTAAPQPGDRRDGA